KDIGERFHLKLILLYGSYAKGTQTSMSDLDVAVLGAKSIDFDVQLDVYGAVAQVFGDIKRELDLVVLEKKDPLFLYQVARNSQLLYGNPTDYHEFRAYAFRNYMDSKDLRILEEKLMKRYQQHLNFAYGR
ncbi:MAG: hypothetical protein A3E07_02865, partial [Candidatus Wildermuthbacteria bacterium RIFCSPHIGHO2_12_FULL_45_9]